MQVEIREIQSTCGNCVRYNRNDLSCEITGLPVLLKQECIIHRFEPKEKIFPYIKETVRADKEFKRLAQFLTALQSRSIEKELRSVGSYEDPRMFSPLRIELVKEPRSMVKPEETPMPRFKNRGQAWGALRKAWKGLKIRKANNDKEGMKTYANRIRLIQKFLGLELTEFPDLGIKNR